MLNFVLCDDNINMLNKLEKMFESIFISNNIDATIVYSTTQPQELLNFICTNKIDVVILDIQLKSDINGLELAEKIRAINKSCYLIFTTGHMEYTLIAYKLKTFDYLPKPITSERLEETVLRILDDMNGLPKKYLKIDNKDTFIDENEIYFIKREAMKLVFHTSTKNYETYSSFNKIQTNLPENFVRCHKSYIVNINNIINIEPVTNTIFFSNDSQCYIGPKYKNNLMEVFKSYGNYK
jgi:two-component system response regulator AgrA